MSMASYQNEAKWDEETCSFLKYKMKLLRREQTYMFLKECKKLDILPKTFRIRFVMPGLEVTDILKKAGTLILMRAIRRARHEVFKAKSKIETLIMGRTQPFRPDVINKIFIRLEVEKSKLLKKYEKKVEWILKGETRSLNRECHKGFINLSSKVFSNRQLNLLNIGPNYVIASKGVRKDNLALDLINAVEAVPAEHRVETEQKVVSLLTLFENKGVSSKELDEIRVCKEIRNMRGIKVCKADKTPHIVVVDKNRYDEELNKFIVESECEILQEDPTKKIESQIRRVLLRKTIPQFLKEAKPPHFCTAPLMFATIKTHNEGVKVRAMVSRGTHPVVNVEKALVIEFGHLLKKHKYRIQSSKQLVEKLSGIDWKEGNNTLHKFDVEALYPSTDMRKAVGTLRKCIMDERKYNNEEVNDINDLLRIIEDTRYFKYGVNFYKQTRGVPIGGTLSGL